MSSINKPFLIIVNHHYEGPQFPLASRIQYLKFYETVRVNQCRLIQMDPLCTSRQSSLYEVCRLSSNESVKAE